MIPAKHTYNIALFDVLGFSDLLKSEGLDSIVQRYGQLTGEVQRQNAAYEEYYGVGFDTSAYWTAEGDIVTPQPCEAAYASDSFVVWSHAYFPAARPLSQNERSAFAQDPKSGWKYSPVPCDQFLTMCCELMCKSVECGLPLRGAIAMGQAVMDRNSGCYLGEPIVEAALLEKAQAALGLSLCSSFMQQHVPARFTRVYDRHIKSGAHPSWSGRALAWDKHWRRTRRNDCRLSIERLAKGSGAAFHYYSNTLRMIDSSMQDDQLQPCGVRGEYPQFSGHEVAVDVLAVRDARRT